jgi:hypothetical protein
LKSSEKVHCLLCDSSQTSKLEFFPVKKIPPSLYYHCKECDLRFLSPHLRLNALEEKARYQEHNNDIHDPRYQGFVSPLISHVLKKIPPPSLGLDFGAGPGPVVFHLLSQHGFQMDKYDPFFFPEEECLQRKYYFICASEVIEHFFKPREEFIRLKSLLQKGGFLALMTSLYDDSIDFESWYYRRDPTHACFYSKKTFQWIEKYFSFSQLDFPTKNVISLWA